MRHHEQGLATAAQVVLQPFYHADVKVVGWLVKHQQVGLAQQHIGQGHALKLSARKLGYGFLEICDFKFRQHLLGAQLEVPSLRALHLVNQFVEAWIAWRFQTNFIAADEVADLARPTKTGVYDGHCRVVLGRLAQITNAQVAPLDDLSFVIVLKATDDVEQRALARTIASYQANAPAFVDGKGNVAEEFKLAETLRQMLDVNIGYHDVL